MIIPLDDKTRIRGTEHCWQFEILKSSGEWRPTKYYQTIGVALHEAAQREIRNSEANGLAEALAACEAVTTRFARIFDDVARRPKVTA